MVTEIVREVAEVLPEHQTNRGNEFRDLSTEQVIPMARAALIARCQVKASNADWDNERYRWHMRQKKQTYFYHAGRLGIDMGEARSMWQGYVHENPAPVEKHRLGLI